MSFVVPNLFTTGELVSAAKYNTIRNSLIAVRDALRPFEVQPNNTPQSYPFRLFSNTVGSFVLTANITTSDFRVYANVNAFVSTNQRVALWGALYNRTTGAALYTTTFAWVTTRPISGNNDVTLYNVSGITIVFRVSSAGEIGFFRTGSSAEFGFSGWFWGGM